MIQISGRSLLHYVTTQHETLRRHQVAELRDGIARREMCRAQWSERKSEVEITHIYRNCAVAPTFKPSLVQEGPQILRARGVIWLLLPKIPFLGADVPADVPPAEDPGEAHLCEHGKRVPDRNAVLAAILDKARRVCRGKMGPQEPWRLSADSDWASGRPLTGSRGEPSGDRPIGPG